MDKQHSSVIKLVPNALVILRILIVPFLVIDALDGMTSPWFVIVFIVAFVSDLIDGPIARRFDAVTTWGSKMDSYADVFLFIAILFCVWRVHSEVVELFWVPIITVGSTQVTSWLISLIKFGKLTHYHSYVAKFWALTIATAVVSLFAFGYAGIFLWLVIVVGVISNFEDMIMTFILPKWSCDVLTIGHAIRLRRELLK